MAKKGTTAKQGIVIRNHSPENFSGRGFDDEWATIKEAEVVIQDFGEKAVGARSSKTAVRMVLELDDGREPIEWHWGIGDPDIWWPSDNGKDIVSTKAKLSPDSNYAIFITAAIEAGFPRETLEETDITAWVGTRAHWMFKKPPRARTFITDSKKEDKVLVMTKISDDKPSGGKAKGKKTTAPTSKPAKAAGGDTEKACVDAVTMTLIANGGEMAKVAMIKAVSGYMPEDWSTDEKNAAIVEMVYKDTWLQAQDSWSFESGILKTT